MNYIDGIKEKLYFKAEHYCSELGIEPKTIEYYTFCGNPSIVFGSIEEDGFEIGVDLYVSGDNYEINRIIITLGKNSRGKSIYFETREEEILYKFLCEEYSFVNFVYEVLENLEYRFDNE